MKRRLLLAFACLQITTLFAQQPVTSADIYLGLKKLNVLGSVLYVAAHPDDENTRLISYFSKDKLYRTGYLSLTRGDGGQNLIGDEQGIELGLIRTQELLAARRIDGGEQFFTRAFDFGYSKTPAETFTKWNKETILSDVVWVIRKFQPDVIITRFPSTGEGGHGHHTASAILANEAFTAAADPKRFPEQLKYVSTWQAQRILWNGFNFNNATPPPDAFQINVGGYNPVLGKSYGEIAAESRSQHKSQGFGSSGNRGDVFEFFRPTGGTEPKQDLFEDVPTTWNRVKAPQIQNMVQAILQEFDFQRPEQSVKALLQLYNAIDALPAGNWKEKKLDETAALIEACLGLYADATTTVPSVAQSDSVRLYFTINSRLGASTILNRIVTENFDSSFKKQLARNINEVFWKAIEIPAHKPITQPYWLRNTMKEGYYDVSDQQLIGRPDVEPAMNVIFHLEIEGQPFRLRRSVRYRYNDPVKGEVYQPFVILPGIEARYENENYFSVKGATIPVRVRVQSNARRDARYVLSHQFSRNWSASMPRFNYETKNNAVNFSTSDFKPLNVSGDLSEKLQLVVTNGSTKEQAVSRRTISYDHIPTITYFPPAVTNLVAIDLKTEGKKVGYIVGAGDKVPEALEQMGYEVSLLSDKELSRNSLSRFDAIITGVRAYNTNEWLNNYYEKLMQYVREGGNLIVQYNTSNNIGPVRAKIGPYPFDISRTRVTDEQSPVVFLKPEHPVLNYPNRITQEDFKGWIQERSIYHAAKWDSSFQSILGLADPGEKPEEGSLVIAPYGKGFFTYTGLVFFRELPAGVPGAYRLMANLIALNRKKSF